MCTVNMTFEVPETKHIDIEALKAQVRNYVGYLISVPGIVWHEDEANDAEHEISPELLGRLENARQEIRKGNCYVMNSKEDINAFFTELR